MIIKYAFSAVAAAAGGCFPANTKRLSFTRRKIKAFPRHSLFLFQHQQTPQNKKSKPASKDSCECRLILCMFCVDKKRLVRIDLPFYASMLPMLLLLQWCGYLWNQKMNKSSAAPAPAESIKNEHWWKHTDNSSNVCCFVLSKLCVHVWIHVWNNINIEIERQTEKSSIKKVVSVLKGPGVAAQPSK